jgi:hypothetical protein
MVLYPGLYAVQRRPVNKKASGVAEEETLRSAVEQAITCSHKKSASPASGLALFVVCDEAQHVLPSAWHHDCRNAS